MLTWGSTAHPEPKDGDQSLVSNVILNSEFGFGLRICHDIAGMFLPGLQETKKLVRFPMLGYYTKRLAVALFVSLFSHLYDRRHLSVQATFENTRDPITTYSEVEHRQNHIILSILHYPKLDLRLAEAHNHPIGCIL